MFLGIDIGSSSSKAVILNADKEILASVVINTGTGTRGPEKAINLALENAGITINEIKHSVVTGYGRITYQNAERQMTEITCHARGAAFLEPGARTVIDIGGQDAKVIRLDDRGKVENFAMNDKCAAGTGRFLEVMARILDSEIGELSELAEQSTEEVIISSTCTVFAESEVISQLAAGARRENVAKGAHTAVAKRVAGLAYRIGVKPEVIMTGGVALNRGVAAALEKEIGVTVTVAQRPQIIGALGAALYAHDMIGKKST